MSTKPCLAVVEIVDQAIVFTADELSLIRRVLLEERLYIYSLEEITDSESSSLISIGSVIHKIDGGRS